MNIPPAARAKNMSPTPESATVYHRYESMDTAPDSRAPPCQGATGPSCTPKTEVMTKTNIPIIPNASPTWAIFWSLDSSV